MLLRGTVWVIRSDGYTTTYVHSVDTGSQCVPPLSPGGLLTCTRGGGCDTSIGKRALMRYLIKPLATGLVPWVDTNIPQVGPVGHLVYHIRDVPLALSPPAAGPSQARKVKVGRHLEYMHNELQLASMPYTDIHICVKTQAEIPGSQLGLHGHIT